MRVCAAALGPLDEAVTLIRPLRGTFSREGRRKLSPRRRSKPGTGPESLPFPSRRGRRTPIHRHRGVVAVA